MIIKISQEAFHYVTLLKKHNIEAEKPQHVPSNDTLFDSKLNSEEDNKIDESLKKEFSINYRSVMVVNINFPTRYLLCGA